MRDYPIEELLWGLGAGLVALAAAGALAVVRAARRPATEGGQRVRGSQPLRSRVAQLFCSFAGAPVTGALMAAAALGAVGRTWPVIPEVLIGVAGLAVAGTLAAPRQVDRAAPLTAAILLAAPFAWLLAVDASSTGWVREVVVLGAALGGVAAARTDVLWGATGLPPVLFAVTAAGVFAAVPDTEQAAALLGASIPVGLAAWPLGRARLGPAGAGAATALLVWVAAVGGRGRQPSIVGAVACLGLMVTLPVGPWLAARWPRRSPTWPRRVVPVLVPVLAHTALVAVASRVAGISEELRVAVPVAATTAVAALGVSTWLARRRSSACTRLQKRRGSVPPASALG